MRYLDEDGDEVDGPECQVCGGPRAHPHPDGPADEGPMFVCDPCVDDARAYSMPTPTGSHQPMTSRLGLAAATAYAATILAANYAIAHVGTQAFPGGPHTIPVGFGLDAPSGVLFIGLAFTFRDVVQLTLGRWATIAAICAGAALSYLVAPSFAAASAVAFLVAEFLDFAVYTPLERRNWLAAVTASNVVGAVVDTFMFLTIAFGSITYWQGQIVGKLWMTVAALVVLVPIRRRLAPAPTPAIA